MYGEAYPTGRLVKKLAEKAQRNTQRSGRRPYGVGLLVVGYDANGPHLFENDPSGTYFEYKAQSIGNRSQSARTYLEKNFESFPDCTKEELIRHSLKALRATLSEKKKGDKDKEPDQLTKDNCLVGIVGKDTPFTILTTAELEAYLGSLDEEKMEDH
jgi:20S proteasome subunit alpha 6